MTTPALRLIASFALIAFTFLCISLAVKFPRDMVLTVNVHHYPEFEPRDVHKETVFGSGGYIYQYPAPAEDDESFGPPAFGTPKPVQTPVKELE